MWRVLRRPSWVAFSVLVLVLAFTFVELGRWQLRRHDERVALNARVAAAVDRPAVPVDELLSVDLRPAATTEWRQVDAVGSYDAAHEILVRNQQFEGALGFEVITPLITTDEHVLLVDRGWVPAGETATEQPVVPAAPAGQVAITARVRLGSTEGAGADGLPESQVRRVVVPEIAAALPYPVYGAYASLLPGEPGTGAGDAPPRAGSPPEPTSGPHLAYAVQWFLFVPLALGGWVVLLRAELRPAAPRAGGVRSAEDRPRVHT